MSAEFTIAWKRNFGDGVHSLPCRVSPFDLYLPCNFLKTNDLGQSHYRKLYTILSRIFIPTSFCFQSEALGYYPATMVLRSQQIYAV